MKISETFWLTVEIQFLTLLTFVAVVIFLTIPRSAKKEFLELGLVLTCSLIIEVVGSIGVFVFHTNMNLVSNLHAFFAFPLFVLLYRKHVRWKNKNIMATVVIIPYLTFATTNLLFFQGLHGINSYTNTLESICLVILSIAYFQVLLNELPTQSIAKLPMFWIDSAIIFYYSGGFFLFLTADYLVKVLNNDLITFWMIHHTFSFVYLCMMCYALLLVRKQ